MSSSIRPRPWFLILAAIFAFAGIASSQRITSTSVEGLLGTKLKPDAASIVKEIEGKTGRSVYAEFRELDDFQLGVSFIAEEDGRAVVLVDPALQNDTQRLEAVIVHELLHLRLRVNGYPSYIFSRAVRTARGLAIDVEQGNINDLRNLIEHEVFRSEMERFGLHRYVDLAGDTLASARARKGQQDGQADTINYARAILEYQLAGDVAAVKKAYTANGWSRALADGQAIAAIIRRSPITTPKAAESVFLQCLLTLYPPPRRGVAFTLTNDPRNKYFRQLIVNLTRAGRK